MYFNAPLKVSIPKTVRKELSQTTKRAHSPEKYNIPNKNHLILWSVAYEQYTSVSVPAIVYLFLEVARVPSWTFPLFFYPQTRGLEPLQWPEGLTKTAYNFSGFQWTVKILFRSEVYPECIRPDILTNGKLITGPLQHNSCIRN